MNQQAKHNRVVIWTSCVTAVLIVTFLIALGYSHLGIGAPLIVLLISAFFLQVYKSVYEGYALRRRYDLDLVLRITNCWIIYRILNGTLVSVGIFAYLIMLAETGITSVPKSVWLVIVVLIAYVLSLWPIQQLLRKDNYCGKERHPINTIEAFAARFVILYSFIVYYLIAFIEATDQHLIPTAFVLYLGVDRLISMFNTIKEYEQKAYNSLFRDTARWIRKRRGMDIAQVQPE